jgi:hypothetical protein
MPPQAIMNMAASSLGNGRPDPFEREAHIERLLHPRLNGPQVARTQAPTALG